MRPDATHPPVDAPFVPGGGAAATWRRRGWAAWVLGAAGAVVGGFVVLLTGIVAGSLVLFLVAVALLVAAIPLGVSGANRRWAERHDVVRDDVTVYATGSAADLMVEGRDDVGVRGTVGRDGRPVAVLAPSTPADPRDLAITVGTVTVRLERRGGPVLGFRAVDRSGREHRVAVGHRAGDVVDWVLPGPGGGLRLRQHLRSAPSRRTLLDGWGRAWATRDDVDHRYWSAQLPRELDDLSVAFCLALLVHVDGLGLEHSHADDAVRPDAGPDRWTPVQGVAVRPARRRGPENALAAAMS